MKYKKFPFCLYSKKPKRIVTVDIMLAFLAGMAVCVLLGGIK